MAVVGSTIRIDIHVTDDGEVGPIRRALRQRERIRPEVDTDVQTVIEESITEVFEAHEISEYDLSVQVRIPSERVPGAPRERITADLDLTADKGVVADLEDAISTPVRAQIADAIEVLTVNHLAEKDLAAGVNVIVSVPPLQFR